MREDIVGTGIQTAQPSPSTLYADEHLALLTSASFTFSVHAMLTTSFRSLRAITGMAKHGAYRRTQHSWQILLRSYVSTTRRTAASLLLGHPDDKDARARRAQAIYLQYFWLLLRIWSGFSRYRSALSHPSVYIPIFQCKISPPFS
jgi:hypothetical protein